METDVKEAVKLGLSDLHGAGDSHSPRVTWPGQVLVWVVMGNS